MSEITFNYVPPSQVIPGTYPEVASDEFGASQQSTLIVGQTTQNVEAVPFKISSVARAVALFGKRSMVASMAERYLSADPDADLWVLGLEDAEGATKAAGSIAFTGTPTAAGTLSLYIGGRNVQVAVDPTMTAATIATAVAAAITAYVDANQLGFKKKNRFFRGVGMPVTAAVDEDTTTQVDLTAVHGGTCGNFINTQLNYYGTRGDEVTPPGLTVAVTQLTGGAGDPDTSTVAAALGNTLYDFIVQPYTTTQALDDFQTMMSDSAGRWNPSAKIFGHVFSAWRAAGNNGGAAVTFGTARNDRHMTVVAYEGSSPLPPYDTAAQYCAGFAALSRSDPARPAQRIALPDLLAPHRSERFSVATQQTLLGSGLALMSYNPDDSCQILRAVTTYQLDENGSPDDSYRDTETLYTLMAVVRQLVADYDDTYPNAKIIDDTSNVGPGQSFNAGLPDQPVVSIKSAQATLVASYSRMASGNNGPILVSDVADFTQNLIVQRNATDPNRFDVLAPVTLATGLRVTAMKIDFALQAAS